MSHRINYIYSLINSVFEDTSINLRMQFTIPIRFFIGTFTLWRVMKVVVDNNLKPLVYNGCESRIDAKSNDANSNQKNKNINIQVCLNHDAGVFG